MGHRFSKSTEEEQLNLSRKWASSPQDNFTGNRSSWVNSASRQGIKGYTTSARDALFTRFYDMVYATATTGSPFSGALFWQLLDQGVDDFRDGFEVVLAENPSTAAIIAQQSKKIPFL